VHYRKSSLPSPLPDGVLQRGAIDFSSSIEAVQFHLASCPATRHLLAVLILVTFQYSGLLVLAK
jgi:hypothetical protein